MLLPAGLSESQMDHCSEALTNINCRIDDTCKESEEPSLIVFVYLAGSAAFLWLLKQIVYKCISNLLIIIQIEISIH